MNILPFVIAVLLTLSYGVAASLQGRLSMHRNQKAYVALRGAEKRILQSSERELFKALGGTPVKKEKKKEASRIKKEKLKAPELPLNPPCARLNLYPLIEEGREEKQALYETAAKIFRIFYQNELFGNEKGFEYRLLDSLLAGAKSQMKDKTSLPLETVAMKDPSLQPIYYLFLKGTKRRQLSKKGYPPLIDYMKIEKSPSQICLFHSHPEILTVFFGFKTGPKLYEELHKEEPKEAMELEAIIQWAADPQLAFVEQGVWELIDFKRAKHGPFARQTIVAEEDGVSIRKDVVFKSGAGG